MDAEAESAGEGARARRPWPPDDKGRSRAVARPPQGLPLLRRQERAHRLQGPGTLKYFITDRGKIIPRRISGNCAKHQRKVALAIKRRARSRSCPSP